MKKLIRAVSIGFLSAAFLFSGIDFLSIAPIRTAEAAFSFAAERGSTVTKASASTTTAVTPSGTISAGNLLIVRVVTDDPSGTSGTVHSAVSDTQGNSYTKISESQRWDTTTAANGVISSLWYSQLTAPLTTSDTVTATHSSVTARVVALTEFNVGSGNGIELVTSTDANGSSTSPSIAVSSLTSGPYLLLGHIGTEGPNGDTFTQDSDYSNTSTIGITGGTTTDNVSSRFGSRIATLTADTFAPTITNRDWAGTLAVFREVSLTTGFAFVAQRGNANTKTPAATTTAVTPNATIAAGNLLIVRVVTDDPSGTSGTVHSAVADTKGNTYTKVSEAQLWGTTTAANGVMSSLWYSQLASALTTSDTVTATHTSVDARVVALTEFAVGAGKAVELAGSQNATGTTTAASITLSGLTVDTYLLVGHIGIEGPNGDAFTNDTTYTNANSVGTTGGTAGTNVASRMGVRITRVTGDIFDTTLGTARDWAGTLAAFKEVAVPAAPTFFNSDGATQIAFNNIRQNTTAPVFRVSSTHSGTFNRFQIEVNTASDFTGTAYTQTFSGTYSSGTEYNLDANSLSPSLPTTDGVTYFIRARASANAGVSYGNWSSGTRSFTYKSTAGLADWFQTVSPQFATDTLSTTATSGAGSVIPTGGAITKAGTDTSGTGNANPLTFNHTLVAGSNRLIVVAVGVENGVESSFDITSVTYGGVAMTKAVDVLVNAAAFEWTSDIWYLLEADMPANGSRVVSITGTGTLSGFEINGFAAQYNGVAQSAPEATHSIGQTSGATVTNTISPSAGSWVVSAAGAGNGGSSWTHGQSQVEVLDFADASSTFAVAELRGANGETALDSTFAGTVNRVGRIAASWRPYFTGTITSTAVAYAQVPSAISWGEARINATTTTGNSAVLQVLDSTLANISGKTCTVQNGGSTCAVSLSDLTPTGNNATLYLRSTLANPNGGLPVLNDWALTWSSVPPDADEPELSSVTIASNNANTARAKVGDTVTLSFTADEPIQTPTVLIAGNAPDTLTNPSGNNWVATRVMQSGDTAGVVAFSINFKDIANNDGVPVSTTTNASSVTFDKTAPTVDSIVRANSNPTNAASVDFTVTFTEDVTGVGTGDFELTTTGVTGASVTGVAGGPVIYTVTVSTGSGSGTIRLDVPNTATVFDLTGNALASLPFTGGQVYDIDTADFEVDSIVRADTNPTNAASVDFTVTFTKNASNVNAADFELFTTGVTGASISGVTGSDDTYTVTVNTGSGSGTIRLDVSGSADITDNLTNPLGNIPFTTGEVYTIDKTAPQVDSIVRVSSSPTNASTVQFTVTFTETVSGVSVADFDLFTTGVTGATITGITGGPSAFTVTVNTGSGNGTIRLDLDDDGSIQDTLGNLLVGGDYTTGEVYVIDKTAPQVQSIVRANTNPTNAASVDFTVTFTENVTGVGTADFELTTTGVTGVSITGVSGSDDTYTVTVNTGSGDGTIRLDVPNTATITDLAGNALTSLPFTAGEVYDIDKADFEVSSIVRADSNPTNAASVDFTVTFSKNASNVNAADFELTTTGVTGATITGVTGSDDTYTVTVNTGSGNGTIRLDVAVTADIEDNLSNALGNIPYTSGEVYTIDKTAPQVDSIVRASANPTSASTVNFTVTFTEDVTGVGTGDFDLTTTGSITGASITGVTGGPLAYTVTVNTGSGNGTIRLDLIDDGSIADLAGNLLAGGDFLTGQVYTVDKDGPEVDSIVRADSNPTNASSVDFIVTFTEAVTGVSMADFDLTTTGVTGASITSLVGGPTVFTVTVHTGSGSGTIRLDLDDDGSIKDTLGNDLVGGDYTTGEVYTIDKTAPQVDSIVRADANPTNAASVNFTVTFTEDVTGVDETDFDLTAVGVTGSSITSVSGGPAIYTVTVSTGSGTGTIRLDLDDDGSITDLAGNLLAGGDYTAGEAYDVDTADFEVTSIVRADANPTNAASVNFTVTFNKDASNVDATDFTLTTTGVSGASITGVSGSTDVYTVSVNTGSGSGTIRLDVAVSADIEDTLSNLLSGLPYTSGQAYTIDKTAPQTQSIARSNPTPTSAATVDFIVTFDSPVTGVDTADFDLTTTGVTGASVTGVAGGPTTYTVTVSTGSGDGTIRLDLIDNGTIADTAGNLLTGGDFTTGGVYDIDKTAPEVDSIVRVASSPTNTSTIQFTVTFTEDVTGFSAGDLALTTTGTIAGASIASVAGGPSVFTVTVNTGTGDGTIRLDLIDDGSVQDAAGNDLAGGNFATGEVYTLDKTAPQVQSIIRADVNPTNAATVDFTVTFDEDVTGVGTSDFTLFITGSITGASIAGVTGSDDTYTVTINTGSGVGTIRLDVPLSATVLDLAGNALAGLPFTTGQAYDVDTADFEVDSIVRADANPTNAASVDFTVTFNKNASNVTAADFTLFTTGVTGAAITGVTGTDDIYTVTVNTGSGDGIIRLDVLVTADITDALSNTLANIPFTSGEVYTIDKTAPEVDSIVRANTNPTNASSVDFTVTFTEDVTGVGTADFDLTVTGGITGASITGVTGGPVIYTVTVNTGSGDGTIRLDVPNTATITDLVTNAIINLPFTAGEVYTIDKTGPEIDSIVRADSNPTNASTVNFTVTFTENATGVSVADFDLFTTGVTGATITGIIGGPSMYTVTVNTGSGDGTIRLDLDDDGSIQDAVGNAFVGGDYTTGEVYDIDKTAPQVNSILRADANPTNASTVDFTVTFTEDVTGVGTSDFDLTTTGVTGATITGITGSDDTYTVTVNTGSGSGTIRLDIPNTATITDLVTNALIGLPYTSGEVYTIDKTAPTVDSIVRADSNPTNAASVDFTVTFTEDVSGVTTANFTIDAAGITGATVTGVSGSNDAYTVSVSTGTGNGTLSIDFDADGATVTDPAGNIATADFTAGEAYTIDKTAPQVQSIVRANANPTNASTVDFTVTFTEDVTGVGTADFDLTTTGVTGATITGVTGSDDTYTVTVNTGSGDGTIRLDVPNTATVSDLAGNAITGLPFTAGETYTIDKTAPQVDSIVRAGTNPTNASSVDFTVTFDEDVTGVGTSDFDLTVTGITGASVTAVTPVNDSVYTVTVNTGSGDGTIRLDVPNTATSTDAAGNTVSGLPFTSGEVYTIDKTAPTIDSIVRADTNPTNASTVDFTVTFSENVTGVATASFTIDASGVTGASVTGIAGVGDTYTVTVNTGSGDGTLSIDFDADGAVVTDAAGNIATADFTAGEAYTIDKTAPQVDSIVRANSNPTNAATVDFTVTFDEDVTGVDTADFALFTSGVAGASITGVTGTDDTYTVTVNTGTGSGTIRLDIPNTATITDLVGNALSGLPYTGGETYTIDKTAPAIQSITRADANPTSAATVDFDVVFTESVTGVDTTDFDLFITGSISGASITGISGSADTYTVTVNTGTGQGTIRLDLDADGTITDAATNVLTADFTAGEAYDVDHVGPIVQSITPSDTLISDADAGTGTFSVTIVYDEAMDQGTAPLITFTPDVVAGGTLTLNGTSGWSTATTYVAVYDVADLNVTVADVDISVTGAMDVLANPQSADTATDAFDIDTENPVITSAVMQDTNTDGKIDRIILTFSEALADTPSGANGFDITSAVNHGSCTGEVADPSVSASLTVDFSCAAIYTAVGDLTLSLTANAGITDAAGNQAASVVLTAVSTPALTDGAAPIIVSTTPANGAAGVPRTSNIVVNFSEPMTAMNVLSDTDSNSYSSQAWSSGSTVLTGIHAIFTPVTLVTISVTGATAQGGTPTALAGPASFAFTTMGSGGGGGGGGGSIPALSSFLINNGSPTVTGPLVTLSITAENAAEILIDNGSSFNTSTWQSFTSPASIPWTLLSGTGTRTVCIMLRSAGGVLSPAQCQTIEVIEQSVLPPTTEPTEHPFEPGLIDPSTGRHIYYERYELARLLREQMTISRDKVLPDGETLPCRPHELIKLPDDGDPATQRDSSVYYCGTDGHRYVFPNEATYFSWYAGWGGIRIVSEEELAAIPIGENVTVRPGIIMVKFRTDDRVYAVAPRGVLRWVTDEAIARLLYSAAWNKHVIDVSDAFFGDYRMGDPIYVDDLDDLGLL